VKPKAVRTLHASLDSIGLSADHEHILRLERYVDLIREWNRIMNLVGEASDAEMVHRHLIDSLMPMTYHPRDFTFQDKKVLDAGTGAGLPGIPLHIIEPSMRLVLVESRQKKCEFLHTIKKELVLPGTKIVAERLEDSARVGEYRERFDIVLARALGKLNLIAELCIPFLKVHGFLIVYKSMNYREELDESRYAIDLLGGSVTHVAEYTIPRTNFSRSLIYIRKVKRTPEKYPRRAGIPQKRPLLQKKK